MFQVGDGVEDGLPLRDGDPLVVHDLDSAVVIIRQVLRGCAGAGEAAGHGDVDDLVIFFQQSVPAIQDISYDRHRGVDLGVLLQVAVKLFLCQCDIFVKQLVIDVERHWKHRNSQYLALFLRDPAVAVCEDRDLFTHTHLPCQCRYLCRL